MVDATVLTTKPAFRRTGKLGSWFSPWVSENSRAISLQLTWDSKKGEVKKFQNWNQTRQTFKNCSVIQARSVTIKHWSSDQDTQISEIDQKLKQMWTGTDSSSPKTVIMISHHVRIFHENPFQAAWPVLGQRHQNLFFQGLFGAVLQGFPTTLGAMLLGTLSQHHHGFLSKLHRSQPHPKTCNFSKRRPFFSQWFLKPLVSGLNFLMTAGLKTPFGDDLWKNTLLPGLSLLAPSTASSSKTSWFGAPHYTHTTSFRPKHQIWILNLIDISNMSI